MNYSFQEESAMDLRSLRFLVLWPHKSAMEECLLDVDFADSTRHFSMRNAEGMVVACCTIVQEAKEVNGKKYTLRLRAMAAHPNVRRMGLSKQLLDHVIRIFPGESFWCDAREVAVPFYLNCGWEVKSEVYDIPQIGPHYLMVKNVQ